MEPSKQEDARNQNGVRMAGTRKSGVYFSDVEQEKIVACTREKGGYSTIHFIDGRHELVHATLTDLEGTLDNRLFVRTHARHLVNFNAIRSLRKDSIILDTGIAMPVSQSGAAALTGRLDGLLQFL